jgi:hypothetical protein
MDGARELAQADLGPLGNNGNIFDTERCSALGHQYSVLDIVNVSDQAYFADVDLLKTGLNETSARVGIVVRELLLDLGEAQPIRDELVGINADLILARRTAKAGNVHNIGN